MHHFGSLKVQVPTRGALEFLRMNFLSAERNDDVPSWLYYALDIEPLGLRKDEK